MSGGWWTVARLSGVPVRIHWSALLGALFFTGLRFAPGAWLGFVLVILAHELGHALVVLRTGQRLVAVDVHGLGGVCQWTGSATPIQRALIAWGGVAAQLVLALVALPLGWALGPQLGAFGLDLFHALTISSLWLAALNLLPFGPFDGAEAWKLPGLLRDRWRARQRRREAAPMPQIRVLDDTPWREPGAPRSPAPAAATPRAAPAAPTRDPLAETFARLARDAHDARRPRR